MLCNFSGINRATQIALYVRVRTYGHIIQNTFDLFKYNLLVNRDDLIDDYTLLMNGMKKFINNENSSIRDSHRMITMHFGMKLSILISAVINCDRNCIIILL